MDGKEARYLLIGQLLSGELDKVSFDTSFSGDWEMDGLSFKEIRFSGSVTNSAGILRLSGTVRCELSAPCARCLAPVKECHTTNVECVVSTDPEEVRAEEERVLAVGEAIDLLETAENALLPDLPFRLLCREDCRGLCPVCGKDLNLGDCGCKKQAGDPRLAGLADFFKES
ncbi:MAG: DUF177 domain-containing protein [Clostridia bacterium]|nr:DUF177 domain-containing protein [Clostridia bacterium]